MRLMASLNTLLAFLALSLLSYHCNAAGDPLLADAQQQSLLPGGDKVFQGRNESQRRAGATQWIFPVLRNGPNNQKRDLRNALAMARKMKAGIILTGLVRHARERLRRTDLDSTPALANMSACFEEHPTEWGYMNFEDVLDRGSIDEFVPTITVPELMEQGWNGELDAIVAPATDPDIWDTSLFVNRSLYPVGVRPAATATHIVAPLTLRCNGELMQEFKTAIKPFKYIGVASVYMTHQIVPNLLTEKNDVPANGTCRHAVYAANRLLRRAQWIREVGQRYVTSQLQGAPYLAVHVRPYGDRCLDEWRRINSSDFTSLNLTMCHRQHQDLHIRLPKCIQSILLRDNLTKVFVMAYPAIQNMVKEILTQAGVTDVSSLSTQTLVELSNCVDTSSTYLSMVEEEVAAQSSTFLGTTWSSITHSIAFERMGLNATARNDYWESVTC